MAKKITVEDIMRKIAKESEGSHRPVRFVVKNSFDKEKVDQAVLLLQ